MRTILMATGDIALPTLDWLLSGGSETELVAVVTGEDQKFGRPAQLRPPKIKVAADTAGVPVMQPKRLSDVHDELEALQPDLIVVMAYGQILRARVLEMPRLACLNLHASILPRHRGASPIQAAILAGDERSGITVMHMAKGLDTGDMVHVEELELGSETTGGELHDELAVLAPAALEKALALVEEGQLPRTPQDDELATYAGKLSRDEAKIDWSMGAVDLERRIRAFHPWPGTWTTFGDSKGKTRRLKILPGIEVLTGSGDPGVVTGLGEEGIDVATAEGLLRIRKVQAEGSRAMEVGEFLNGTKLEMGAVLGRA